MATGVSLSPDKIIFRNMDARNFLHGLPSSSANMVLTDPPYLVSKATGFASIGEHGVERFRMSMDFGQWDKIPNGEHIALLEQVFGECYRILRNGGTIIVFYDLWKLESLANILRKASFKMLRFIEWVKTNPVPLNSKVSYLTNAREIAIVATKGSKPIFNASYHNGIFKMPIHRDGGKRLHPTQKPEALMRELITLHTHENDVVLDPFAGSGTSLVAAAKTGRVAWGCEIDKTYFEKANYRLGNGHDKS